MAARERTFSMLQDVAPPTSIYSIEANLGLNLLAIFDEINEFIVIRHRA